MRKFSVVLATAMFLLTGTVFANDGEGVDPAKSITARVSQLLSNHSFTQDDVELTGQVRFTLNNVGEIVVLSVDSESEDLVEFVKARLNYKKVDVSVFKEGKLYTIPVRIAE